MCLRVDYKILGAATRIPALMRQKQQTCDNKSARLAVTKLTFLRSQIKPHGRGGSNRLAAEQIVARVKYGAPAPLKMACPAGIKVRRWRQTAASAAAIIQAMMIFSGEKIYTDNRFV